MMQWYWVSVGQTSFGVAAYEGDAIFVPPPVSQFRGQPIENLLRWIERQPGGKWEEEKGDDDGE